VNTGNERRVFVLVTVCVGDGIGIVLMLMVLVTNKDMYFRGTKNRSLKWIIFGTMLACACDITAFAIDGIPGKMITILSYAVNSWLFIAVALVSYFWVGLLCECIGVNISKRSRRWVTAIDIVGLVILVINFFDPIIFTIKDNVYQRGTFYWLYVAIGVFNMVYGLVLYRNTRRKGGLLVSFSVSAFVVPMIIGTTVQSLFYGVSVTWVGVAVAVSGMVSSMKNELIYIDQLTGIYNRYYLEKIKNTVSERGNSKMTGIMADLNRFKLINDKYGHKVGDEALIKAADIFVKAAGTNGKVIRYAGDEFVIILNLTDSENVSRIIDKIREGFESFNAANPDGYQLSAAIGYETFNFKEQSVDEFMNTIDAKMYENKRKSRMEQTK